MTSNGADPLEFTLDGAVDNYAVMGDPVAHSKSPRIHHAFAAQTGRRLHYGRIRVPSGRFPEALDLFGGRGGKGLNITLPYKEEAWRAATVLTTRALLAGAVNTLTFTPHGELEGDNTDGAGLVQDMDHNGIRLAGRRVLVLGAGGAVRGVLGPLMERSPAAVVIANRTPARAEKIVATHPHPALSACGLPALQGLGRFDVLINSISAGLQGEMPPLPASLADADSACYDMLYGDAETPFCRWGHRQGAAVVLDGLGMLVEQAAESFLIWQGVRPETGAVIEMLRSQGKQKK